MPLIISRAEYFNIPCDLIVCVCGSTGAVESGWKRGKLCPLRLRDLGVGSKFDGFKLGHLLIGLCLWFLTKVYHVYWQYCGYEETTKGVQLFNLQIRKSNNLFIFRVLSCSLKKCNRANQSEMCVILIGLANTQQIISRKRLFITLGERDWAADNRTRGMLFPSLIFFGRQDDECVFKSF